MDEADHGKIRGKCCTGSYGYYAQEHHGKICRTDTLHTRHAIDVSSNGKGPEQWYVFSKPWQKILETGEK